MPQTSSQDSLESLTPRQRQILELIEDFTRSHGYPPTVRNLQAATGIASPNGILCHLRVLRQRGWLTWDYGAARSLRVLRALVGTMESGSESSVLLKNLQRLLDSYRKFAREHVQPSDRDAWREIDRVILETEEAMRLLQKKQWKEGESGPSD